MSDIDPHMDPKQTPLKASTQEAFLGEPPMSGMSF